MPQKELIYDLENPDAEPIEMWSVDAREALKNDPDRYSKQPPEPKKAEKKAAKAAD